MARKPFDPLREFDSSYARELGTRIGTAKRMKRENAARQSMLQAAAKEAAKKERDRLEKEEREKKSGKKESKVSKDNETARRKIEAAGGSAAKPQSAIGKALNLDPDNNLFFDALDLMGRPINAIRSADMKNAELVGSLKKDFKAGKISEKEYYNILNKESNSFLDKEWWDDAAKGLKGEVKPFGTDMVKKMGVDGPLGVGLGIGLDIMQDPLNFAGGAIGKGITTGTKAVGKGLGKIPGMDKVTRKLDDIFVGKKAKQETLNRGETTDDLLQTERAFENMRLAAQDRSQNTVARAMREGGKRNGRQIGEIMEEPLRMARPLDISAAPNVLNSSKALDNVGRPQFNATDPLGRASEVSTKATQEFKVLADKVTDKEVKDWLKSNGLPGADKKGRVSKFNKELYITENRQRLASRVQIETKVRSVLNSTKDSQKAAQAIKEMPEFKARFRGAAQTLMNSNDDIRKWAADNGIDVPDLEGYMAHFLTKEAHKFVDDAGESVSSGASITGGDSRVMGRKLKDSTKNANIKMKAKTNIDEWFNPDAFVATAGGQQRMINFIAKESVKNKVIGDSRFAKLLPAGANARKGFVKMEIDGKAYEITKGAKEVITNFEKHVTDDGVKTIMDGFDKIQNLWKKSALFSVGYHIRNFSGNAFNMYVSGMRPDQVIGRQTEAFLSLEAIKQARVGKALPKGTPKNAAKQYDEFVGQGLRSTGSAADIVQDAGQTLMGDIRYRGKGRVGKAFHELAEVGKADSLGRGVLKGLNAPFDTSRRLAEEADEVARFALFRHHREAGMSAEKAAEKVREVLFDYTALTQAEQKVFKRMAPFYTWLRKNSEFQIKAFLKNPEKYNHLNLGIQNGFAATDMDQEIMPDYMKDGMAIPLPGDNTLNLNLPAGDLSKMMNPGKLAMDSVSPFIKTPFELAFNKSAMNGAPIDIGETKDFMNMEVGAKTAHALQNFIPTTRNINAARQQSAEGASPLDALSKASGAQLIRPWDAEGYQNQADWKEKERLEKIMNRMKQQGAEIPTVQDLKDQGVPVNEQEEEEQNFLKQSGFDQRQVDMLLALKKKVRNGNAETASEATLILQQMGLPSDVIEMVTSDYLDY